MIGQRSRSNGKNRHFDITFCFLLPWSKGKVTRSKVEVKDFYKVKGQGQKFVHTLDYLYKTNQNR